MTKLFLIAASALVTLASNPVVAREPATTVAPTEQSTTARAERPDRRYCIVETVTGSRIPYKTCRTRAEWLEQGFDPLNPDK